MSARTILLTTDFPPNLGGIATHLWNIYSRSPMDELSLIAPSTQGCADFDAAHEYKSLRVSPLGHIPGLRGLSFVWKTRAAAKRIIAKDSDVVLHCGHIYSALVAHTLKRKYGVPYLVWTYALEVMDRRIAIPIRNALREADLVIAISDYTRGYVEKLGVDPARIVKIRPAADPRRFSPSVATASAAQRFGLVGKRVILSIGTLTRTQRYKGMDMVIRALPAIIRAVPDAVYVIAGAGDDAPYLEALAEGLGVAGHVKILGSMAAEDLPALYGCCDVFALCSREVVAKRKTLAEGFGIVLVEASATGKPVVAGLSGGCPDAVRDGETGLLVDPLDPDAIGTALIRILSNQELAARMGANGRDWVTRELNWDRARHEFDQACARIVPSAAGRYSQPVWNHS